MSKMRAILVAAGVLLFLALAAFSVADAQAPLITPVKLKASSAFPPPGASLVSEILLGWQKEVTKRTNGAVTFETFWGGALGVPAEHLELMKKGLVDVAQADEWYTPGKFPLGEFEFIFPFGPTDPVIMTKAFRRMHEEFPEFARDEAKEKAVWIAFAGGSEYKFLSKKPLRTLDDFKGEKVSLIGRWLSKWLPPGASPVVRPGQERYDLLRSGVVNIDLLPIDLHHAFKTHEQIKYFSNIKIFTPCFATVLMSLDTLNKFPPEVQKIFIEAGKETELRHSQTVVPPYVDKILKDWKARGIQFIDFAKEDEQKWINGLEDIPAIWAAELQAKGYPAFKMVERWQAITSELGFKWARKWGIQK